MALLRLVFAARAQQFTRGSCRRIMMMTKPSSSSTRRCLSDSIRIGQVEANVSNRLRQSHLTAARYLAPLISSSSTSSSSWLSHLQWMVQKHTLAQDMLLIGPPGSCAADRRGLALGLAELLQLEVMVLPITSDLTESDLKQRRELKRAVDVTGNHTSNNNNNSLELAFVSAAPVEAAIHGRILVLDGLEKANRNVLPTLNNLLEHRSMNLEDGRLLVSPDRYQLLSSQNMDVSMVVPVHESFRVIATCTPAPTWANGRPLDPPLRSRFQIRRVEPTVDHVYQHIHKERAKNVWSSNNKNAVSEEHTLVVQEQVTAVATAMMEASRVGDATDSNNAAASRYSSTNKTTTWPLPLHHLAWIQEMLSKFPQQDIRETYWQAYPVGLPDARMVWYDKQETNRTAFNSVLERVHGFKQSKENVTIPRNPYRLLDIERDSDHTATATFTAPVSSNSSISSWLSPSSANGQEVISLTVPCGSLPLQEQAPSYCLTESLEGVVQALVTCHGMNKDVLLVAPSGEGKTATTLFFARRLGYRIHQMYAYPEMTLVDLFLRRVTNAATGETMWEGSPLLQAIQAGELCVLDHVEKLRPDILSALQSLCLDRDVLLPDGRRIQDKRDVLLSPDSKDSDSMEDSIDPNTISVHPSFRLIALASTTKEAGSWLTQDAMSMFATIVIPPADGESTKAILLLSNPNCSSEYIDKLLTLQSLLTKDVASDCGVSQLSTRNLIRITRRVNTASLADAIRQVLVTDLLPPTQRAAFESVLQSAKISTKRRKEPIASEDTIFYNDTLLQIGEFSLPRAPVQRPEMVPSPRFFDIPSHVQSIKDLLQDWQSGERAFLLLGNQGVGKNMVIDRLCEVANFEREYIQLHRDSTIAQLTLQPSLENGLIVWHDSPLLRAAEQGLTLVVDEADKAPTEVLAVLKGLVEDGELLLGDGRRISRHETGPGIIEMHKNFTLVVLANRPGFPFQGNQFFKMIGDCFSTRVIANPDIDSETQLLGQYGPNVDKDVIRSIAGSFAELRSLADRGDIAYPYSTREAVAVIKHLEKYPSDDIISAIHNVIDFDSYEPTMYGKLGEVFKRHGIAVESYTAWQEAMLKAGRNLSVEFSDHRAKDGVSHSPPPLSMPKEGKWDAQNEAHVGGNQWAGGTGGSDTAGLGGRGGPYRLDRGHNVSQVSDEKKAEVSEEAKRAARSMAEKALKDRLEQINMSEDEWDMYQRFVEPIQGEIATLRAILNQVEIKQSERTWLKRQNHGELDEGRLVEGVTGDKFIYKRRGNVEDAGLLQHPQKLSFVVDVSGSMYRFNGYDQRLYRCLETANLIMKSFDGMTQRFDYQIVGHSGDAASLQFVRFGEPPKTEKEMMRVLQGMIAHSQYCQSGDHTLEAVEEAISALSVHGEGNGGIVIAISDANLRRYGIHPRYLGKVIETGNESKVKAHCVFIGSLGNEAEEIKRELPTGRGHICMHTSDLPRIIRDILSSNIDV